jgi:hypothetical protein
MADRATRIPMGGVAKLDQAEAGGNHGWIAAKLNPEAGDGPLDRTRLPSIVATPSTQGNRILQNSSQIL